MRRALLLAAALVLFTCTSAMADGGTVNYTGNVTFANDPSLSFSFSEPGTVTSLDTTTTLTISGVLNAVLPNSEVEFFSSADGGLFDLTFNYLGATYDLALFGGQSYSPAGGSFKLLTGNFPIAGGAIFIDEFPVPVDVVTGGKVTAKTVPAVEPEGLVMLGLGIAALVMLRKKQFGSAAV
jgi:hypothetical protein